MLQEYQEKPSRKGYKEGIFRINALDAFRIKDELKSRGYKFDSVTRCWYHEGSAQKIKEEKEFLNTKDIKYKLEKANSISFKAYRKIPDIWRSHQFTEEEKEKLLAGKQVYLNDCVSMRTGKRYGCHVEIADGKIKPIFD